MDTIFDPMPQDVMANFVTQLQWVLDSPIETKRMQNIERFEVACDADWTENADYVLADKAHIKELNAKGKALLQQQKDADTFSAFEKVEAPVSPCQLFLKKTEFTAQDLIDALELLTDENSSEDDLDEELKTELLQGHLRLLDGEVVQASEDPSHFSEISWEDPETSINLHGNTVTVKYHSAYTNDVLWYAAYL